VTKRSTPNDKKKSDIIFYFHPENLNILNSYLLLPIKRL
jgi:hypothetical protein